MTGERRLYSPASSERPKGLYAPLGIEERKHAKKRNQDKRTS